MLETQQGSTPVWLLQCLVANRLQADWSVDRLAQVVGVSSRTLHRIFERECGTSPMSLVRRVRLDSARRRLEAPGPGATVTAVALDCGFAHLGRFSVSYARQFGESPSETLRRSREGARSVPPTALATGADDLAVGRGAA